MKDKVLSETTKKGKRMQQLLLAAFFIINSSLLMFTACTSIDCPVQNSVYTVYDLKKSDGLSADTLRDTLTISTTRFENNDTVLLNRSMNTTSFSLPISYTNDEDTLYFEVSNPEWHSIDTVYIKKDNLPHFESVDCQVSFFHNILEVRTTHHAIDSIVINKKFVDYEQTTEHFHIYFKNSR